MSIFLRVNYSDVKFVIAKLSFHYPFFRRGFAYLIIKWNTCKFCYNTLFLFIYFAFTCPYHLETICSNSETFSSMVNNKCKHM